MSEEQKPETTMDEIIEKLKNTIFKEDKTTGNDSLCNVDETYTHYTNCATEKSDIAEHVINPDLPPGKCGSVEINKNCIDFFFEKLNELTDEQKLTLNSLKYILVSSKKKRSFSIWGYLLINQYYNYLLRLSEQLEVKFAEDDVVYIKHIVNQSNSSNTVINFLVTLPIDVLKTLPIDVLKTLPSNILINLPTKVFNNLSKNNLFSKTKMKARTVGRVKGWLGYGGTKKKRASKRRKNNKRSRRIPYT